MILPKNRTVMMRKLYLSLFVFVVSSLTTMLYGQQYTSTTGLIHTPSAEMNPTGTARVGGHYMSKLMMPRGMKYDSWTHYVSVTPYKWIEIGYTAVLYSNWIDKDRHFSIKIRPITEGKYRPAIVIGADDPVGSSFNVNKSASMFYSNYYAAASKHFNLNKIRLGAHLSYRHYFKELNSHDSGITAGVTLSPIQHKQLRVIAEYGASVVNIGADYYLWNLILIQLSCSNLKEISAGVALQINLN